MVCVFECVSNEQKEFLDTILLLISFSLDLKGSLASSDCNNQLISPLFSNKNVKNISQVELKAMAKDVSLDSKTSKCQQFPYFCTWRMQKKCTHLPFGLEMLSRNNVLSGYYACIGTVQYLLSTASHNYSLKQCKFGSVSLAHTS